VQAIILKQQWCSSTVTKRSTLITTTTESIKPEPIAIMSITYEEALGTLTAMFTTPWKEDSLDTILRHFEGHMENTVDAVLSHSDSLTEALLKRLQSSQTGASISDMEEQLMRHLANQEERGWHRQTLSTSTNARPSSSNISSCGGVNPIYIQLGGPSAAHASPARSPATAPAAAASAPAPAPVPAQAPAAKKGRGI